MPMCVVDVRSAVSGLNLPGNPSAVLLAVGSVVVFHFKRRPEFLGFGTFAMAVNIPKRWPVRSFVMVSET